MCNTCRQSICPTRLCCQNFISPGPACERVIRGKRTVLIGTWPVGNRTHNHIGKDCRRRRRIGARPIESTLRQLSAKTNIRPLITRAHCCRCCCWLFNEGNITCSACWETFTTSSLAYEVFWPKLRRSRFIESNGFISWILFRMFRSSKIDQYIPACCYNNQTLKSSSLFYSKCWTQETCKKSHATSN